MDSLDELIKHAPDMASQALASGIIEACGNDDRKLVEWTCQVAQALPINRREALFDRIGMSAEQRARVAGILAYQQQISAANIPIPSGRFDSVTTSSYSSRRSKVRSYQLARGDCIDHRYEVLAPLGRGGMGEVYTARDRRLRRKVALKLLTRIADREMVDRFLREARITAECKHENIVDVYDLGEHRDSEDGPSVPYMVLEYLEGKSLRELFRQPVGDFRAPGARGKTSGSIALRRAVDLIISVVRALVCAHGHDIVHRDLKPENIFIKNTGEVIVLDFGIAKSMARVIDHEPEFDLTATAQASTVDTLQTRHGVVMGSVWYMAPEQWRMYLPARNSFPDNGEGGDGAGDIETSALNVDQRADIWAIGIMLYEMISGKHPLHARTLSELRSEVCDFTRPMPRLTDAIDNKRVLDRAPSVNSISPIASVASIVEHCLVKRRDERMSSTEELLSALEDVRSKFDLACVRYYAVPWLRWMLPLVALLAVLSIAVLWMHAPETVQARPDAAASEIRIPAFPDDFGGVVLAHDSEEAASAQAELCAELGGHAPPGGIACIALPVRDEHAQRRAAAAGAALVVFVDSADSARLIPIVGNDSPALDRPIIPPIVSRPPLVRISTPRARAHVASLVMALRQLVSPHSRSLTRDVAWLPETRVADVGWRGATLMWMLRSAGNDQSAISTSEIKAAIQRCSEHVSVADWYCAAAHYVYSVHCGSCSDTGQVLDRLASRGHTTFRIVAAIEKAHWECQRGLDPAKTARALARVARAWVRTDCRRWTLVGAASCLLVSAGETATTTQEMAFPERNTPILADCAQRSAVATALAERGKWHYEWNELTQAETDFARAWELDATNPSYVVRWAEAFLHLRYLQLDDAERRQLADQLSPDPRADAGDQVMIAFLRWVGIRDEQSAAELDRVYAEALEGAPALRKHHDPHNSLARMACELPPRQLNGKSLSRPQEGIVTMVCDVYRLLTEPVTLSTRARLRAHLFTRSD